MAATIGTFEIERTVPMNMYSLSKGRCCLITIVGLLLGITVAIVGFVGPSIFVIQNIPTNFSLPTSENNKYVYSQILNAPLFGRFNRQVCFRALSVIEDSRSASISLPVNISINFQPLLNESSSAKLMTTTRLLHCPATGVCDYFDIARFVRLPEGPFSLGVTISTNTPLRSLTFSVLTFNPDYTGFELWLRVSLVFFAFIVVCWFMHSMKKWPAAEWNLEQTAMCFCLPALVFYDDPMFGILLLQPSVENFNWSVADIISFAFRTFYLALLLIFWLSVLHGIRESSRGCCTFYITKIAIVLPLWILGVVGYGWTIMTYADAPETDPAAILSTLMPILIAQTCFFGVILLALVYHFLRSCIEVCRLSFLNIRLTYAACLSFGLLLTFLGMCFSTFAIPEWRPMLIDPLLFFYASPLLGLGLPTLINAHAALSAILYAPAVKKSFAKKDSRKPLVMAAEDDSDEEEVVYEEVKGKRYQYAPVATSVDDKPAKKDKFQN